MTEYFYHVPVVTYCEITLQIALTENPSIYAFLSLVSIGLLTLDSKGVKPELVLLVVRNKYMMCACKAKSRQLRSPIPRLEKTNEGDDE
jgi:hypothetical protein